MSKKKAPAKKWKQPPGSEPLKPAFTLARHRKIKSLKGQKYLDMYGKDGEQ